MREPTAWTGRGDRETVYAIFIDIMGFADSLEALSPDEMGSLCSALEAGRSIPRSGAGETILSRYSVFHAFLHDGMKGWDQDVRAVVEFSDSAFIVLSHPVAAEALAIHAMRHLMPNHVPVRIGIGGGSFARLAFANVTAPNGRIVSGAPFLGTSILRAYRAQACRAKGFRIFLHPSAMRQDRPGSWVYADLPETEVSESCTTELSYVFEAGEDVKALEAGLTHMRYGVTSERALLHYDATKEALGRFVATNARVRRNEPYRVPDE